MSTVTVGLHSLLHRSADTPARLSHRPADTQNSLSNQPACHTGQPGTPVSLSHWSVCHTSKPDIPISLSHQPSLQRPAGSIKEAMRRAIKGDQKSVTRTHWGTVTTRGAVIRCSLTVISPSSNVTVDWALKNQLLCIYIQLLSGKPG